MHGTELTLVMSRKSWSDVNVKLQVLKTPGDGGSGECAHVCLCMD